MNRTFNADSLVARGVFVLCLFLLLGCSQSEDSHQKTDEAKSMIAEKADPLTNKGIGPIKSIELPHEIDQEMVAQGKAIYEQKCVACHNLTQDLIGPSQAGVLNRRSPEWVMNLILNPAEMLKKDPIAKELLVKYNNIPMTDQQVTEEDARKILEFFRTI